MINTNKHVNISYLDEVLQLQQELQNRERTRDGLANELALTINSNQELHRRLAQVDNMQHELEDLKTKYNALLQVRNLFLVGLNH